MCEVFCRSAHFLVGFCLALGLLSSCGSPPVPKPEGYPRIEFPPKAYRLLDTAIPYSFEMPVYATFQIREDGLGQDLLIPQHRATIYLSYYNRPGALDTLFEEARSLAYKHTIRADAIEELFYENSNAMVYAMLYRISGDVASAVQFYATDSVRHFLRGALYFYCPPNADSLAPAVDFYSEDIVHLLETLEWR